MLKPGACNIIRKETVAQVFSMNSAKFLRTHFVENDFGALRKKLSFLLRISSVNVTISVVSCGFGHIY